MQNNKSDWWHENLYSDYRQSFLVDELLVDHVSPYQKITIFSSLSHGKVLCLDNIVQLTEKDEYIYHETLIHPALLHHDTPKRVLIIGGGDGGALRRVLEHTSVEQITLVEIDEMVVNLSKKWLSSVSKSAFMDERVTLIIDDATNFITSCTDTFDIIITDRGDNTGPGHPLFGSLFYKKCKSLLDPQGIMVTITGIPYLQKDTCQETFVHMSRLFKYTYPYVSYTPTYIGGPMLLMWGSDTVDPTQAINTFIVEKISNLDSQYINQHILQTIFVLPNDILKICKLFTK